jgi:hypothetical protein
MNPTHEISLIKGQSCTTVEAVKKCFETALEEAQQSPLTIKVLYYNYIGQIMFL